MRRTIALVLGLATALIHFPASASFHLNEIIEIFSTADGSVQYIEFLCTDDFQNLMNGHVMSSVANMYTFTSNLPITSTKNHHFLVATQSFADLPGAVTPDYIMPAQFFSVTSDTLTLVGAILPAFTFTSGMLPVDGALSLNGSTNTPRVYTSATNTPQNFAGQIGSIDASFDPANVYVDLDAAQSGVGNQSSPFNTLAAAVPPANAGAVIHIAPSTSGETFTGAGAIAKSLSLVNSNGAGGLVRIGVLSARNTELAAPKTGFVSDRFRRPPRP